ncbi:MAG: DNA polymerase IV, partial [Candidatus Dormibacteraeota bacterium]|nr:DNA polymerase IV [Candidatus Dormibacteraeota bacterium]
SGLADAVQGELFEARPGDTPPSERTVTETMRMVPVAWPPGSDVAHPRWGQGWVEAHEGEDLRVRFETETTDPGPVRHLRADDPDLRRLVPD